MYVWIWHKLPGNVAAKAGLCAVIVLAVVALLFFVIFPWVDPRLPWSQVTVDQ